MSQFSFIMMGKDDRDTVMELLLKGTGRSKPLGSNGYQFYLEESLPKRSTGHSTFMNAIKTLYPTATWLCLKMTTSTAVSLVAKIQTPKGLLLVWRNGWNTGNSNFVVCNVSSKSFFNRADISATLEFIKIYTANKKDMPLFLNCLNSKNKKFVLETLKSETEITHETFTDH